MTLKEYIFDQFFRFHKGKIYSIKRTELLNQVNGGNSGSYNWINYTHTTDREMRLAYEDLPICGSSKGLYLPETKAEIDEQVKLHWSKIYSYFRKIDILEHYQIESDAVQKDLFQ